GGEASTAYVPGLSWGNANRPAPSVFRSRCWPFTSLTMVTVASGIPELVSSVTTPEIALVVSPCADIVCGARRQTARAAKMAAARNLGITKYKSPGIVMSKGGEPNHPCPRGQKDTASLSTVGQTLSAMI